METIPVAFSVSEITGLIKEKLESRFSGITVEGEISNCKPASSGHLYFSLKDSGAVIQAVMFRFRSRAMPFDPYDGMKVRATGSITVYPPRGNYQLMVESMQKAGIGDILARLEELKRKLAGEGLFDQARKRPLPRLPSRIVVVTSPHGAALRDILSILRRRNSGTDVLILPASVQGESAPAEIVDRIRTANRFGLGDVLIVGRGGGSLEDLLAFSDESVVRAVAASEIPVISAVGHETDWSLCDFAADVRAPTPSAAAELVSESRAVIAREISQLSTELESAVLSRIDHARAMARRFEPAAVEAHFMRILSPLVRRAADSGDSLRRGMREILVGTRHRLELAARDLALSSPQAILERGFAVVKSESGGAALRSSEGVKAGDKIRIQLARGSLGATVKETKK